MRKKTYTPDANFIDLLIDAVFAVDIDARVVFASAACERIFGYTPEEMVGMNMFDIMLPEDRERTRQSVGEIMAGHPQLHFENRYLRKDGQIVHLMWATRWSPTDQVRIGVARDITERKHAESIQTSLYAISEASQGVEDLLTLIRRIHQIVGTLLPADNFSVALYDKSTGLLSFPYHADKYDRKPDPYEPMAGTLYARILQSGQPLLLSPATETTDEPGIHVGPKPLCQLGVPLKSHHGTIGVLVLKSYPGGVRYNQKDQELLQFISTQIATAIEGQRMQARLQHMAQYDQLTGLPNRGLLYDRLKTALSMARREHERLSVLYLDLDRFKPVNDTLGHSVGDLLLQEVASRLKRCVRESDTVARIGGDEFVVLLQRVLEPGQAAVVAAKIHDAMSRPFTLDGHTLSIVPSIGIAHYPEHGETAQQMLKHADQAMYQAKHEKKLKTGSEV
ncbi:MAG: sensor domain-containing diguanylate cyclase [Castellaniella sp.]|uniref:diguanylate cyclase domain-containing protein n=1 Tax=Castellaniella sp. TaxID=1955812 RepID=UPI0012279259|nr:diguanylate cyclase [Castellaniella sp.]TAN30013.1 MAG: sensor domain-containing diguanylate cyclase [Castellaniella sp.]